MPLTLSDDELARVAATSQVLLSPLEHPSIEDWGRACMESVQKLLSADQYLFGWPLPGGQILSVVQDASGAAAVRDYLGYYHQVDVVLVARRLAAGVEVYSARGLIPVPGELERTEVYQDWCLPHRLGDAIGMSVSVPEHPTFPVLAHAYREREAGPEFGERGQALLRLLLPAFKAGVQSARQLHERREDLERLLDLVSDGILVFDASGRLLHRNAAAGRMLAAEPGPDRTRLEHEARLTAMAVAALLRRPHGQDSSHLSLPYHQVRGAVAEYRLAGSLLRQAVLAQMPVITVALERIVPQAMAEDVLKARFGLTSREVQVARLLADGKTDAEIAEALAVTRHTASRHAEHVRTKLGVRSRAAVGTRIRGT